MLSSISQRVVAALVAICCLAAAAGACLPAPGGPQATLAALPPAAVLAQRSGDRLLRDGRLRDAAREFVRAARAAPEEPLFRLTAGVALAAVGEVERAAGQFREALSLAEDDVIAALLLEGALEEQGRAGEALVLHMDTVRRFKRGSGQERPAPLDASGSIERLRRGTERFEQSAVLFLLLGDAYQVSGRWDEAAGAYARAMTLAPRWAKPCVNLGVLHLTQERPEQAVAAFEKALGREPGDVTVQLLIGDAQIKAGRPQEALQAYRKVENAAAPARVAAEAQTRIGNVYLQSGQAGKARQSFAEAQKRAPQDPKPAAGLAQAEVMAGNFDAGARAYVSALSLAQSGGLLATRAILYRGLAEAQLSARQPGAALETLNRALSDEPRSAPLWHRLAAEAHFVQGNVAACEAALRRALDSEGDRYPLETLRAIAAKNLLGRVTETYENDDSPGAWAALAHIARYNGDVGDEIALRERLSRERGAGMDWFFLADAYERANRLPDARAAYARAVGRGGLPPYAREQARERSGTAPLDSPLNRRGRSRTTR